MKYLLSKQFTQIAETTGTIQNASHVGTIEMSTSDTPDSGILIYPLQKVSFSDQTIYLRCIDGYAEARVLPFELVTEGGDMQVLKRVFADISYSGSNLAFLSPAGEVLKYFNLPEEIYLRSIGTTFAPNFTWSALAYPNSVNPNLNGKPVLVLHIKGDSLDSPYEDWGFCNLEDLIDLYVPADPSIVISDNSIKTAISNDTGNFLTLKNNGLFVPSDTILDSIPATVNGGLWYEIENDTPVIKIYHNGLVYNIASSDPNAQYLIADMPFTEDLIDKCGNEWTVEGNPEIQNGKLYLNGSSYLQMAEKFSFTGQPFTISLKFSTTTTPGSTNQCLWQLYDHSNQYSIHDRIQLGLNSSEQISLWKEKYEFFLVTSFSVIDGKEHHTECSFDGSTWYFFLDGVLIGSKVLTASARQYTLYIGYNVSSMCFTGYISNFKIWDGVALHTQNFTPE